MNEYALTDKERKWLEQRTYRCKYCIHYKEGICFWCPDMKKFETRTYSLVPDYRDAAEFEARVAARLAGAWAIGEDMCFNNHCQLFDKDRCTACYLKNARIAVEEEMDQ